MILTPSTLNAYILLTALWSGFSTTSCIVSNKFHYFIMSDETFDVHSIMLKANILITIPMQHCAKNACTNAIYMQKY